MRKPQKPETDDVIDLLCVALIDVLIVAILLTIFAGMAWLVLS